MSRLMSVVVFLLFFLLLAPDAGAQRRVTGRVTDQASGQPVAGAAVLLPGSAVGATAADDGTFAITIPDGAVTLLVRRIGYQRQNLPVSAAQTTADVSLKRDILQLETQISTGTATSVAKLNAANDVAAVSAEQMSRVSAPSLENALAGRIAGAQVSANSGAPGGGNQIRLRGVTSVFGSADPLYVVDGVIVSNEVIQSGLNSITAAARTAQASNSSNQDNGVNRIADLNPNDIESLEVLKGASASAIYGSKASNGVIIIKTKQGTAGAASGYPAVDFIQRFGTRALNRKIGGRHFTLDDARVYGIANGMTQAAVDSNYAACNGYCDFEEQLFGEHPLNFETSLAVRGGIGQTSYFASGLNSWDGGIQKNTGYRKQSLRLNLTQLVRQKFTLTVNNNLIRTLTMRGVSNNDNANVTPYFVFATTPTWFDMRPSGSIYPRTPIAGTNVFQDRDFIRNPEEVYRLISSVGAAYAAFANDRQNLTFRLDAGIDRFNQQDNIVSPRFLFFENNDGLPGTVTSLSANVMKANANLSAVHEFSPMSHSWSATTSAGLQREISSQRSTNIVTRDVLLGQENINRGAATEVYADRQAVRGLAVYAQEEFLGLGERLLLTAGARGERSTLNGDIDKFYFFPKASASYRMPGFLGRFDEFKLRIATGQSGNQPLYIQKYTPATIGTLGGQISFQPGLIRGNDQIRPERETEVEGGIDASMFNQRASLALTVYQKSIKDLILNVVAAPSLGYNVAVQNGGSIRNRGTEVALGLTPIETGNVSWMSRMTFARNIGIVTSLPAGIPFFNVERDATGQRVAFGSGYGIGRLEVGKRVTQIVATDSVGGTLQEVQKGDAAPDFTMGFGNDLTFGKLRFTSLFDWSHGGDLVNITMDVYDAFGLSPNVADGGSLRATRNDGHGVSQYVLDGSYVKLRELTLSYELPQAFAQRLRGAGSARIELSGRNLKTWSSYPGVDPESSNFGSQAISRFVDLAPYPPSRTFYLTFAASY
ncbi:MAG TPA: SusC/RagA family TonB-linked outer membrane protein [Gemmatimonadaceae bacterium]|nr:SusC/RagA family TonB-linked outer membrane protein [Gemmatimonadaceae bacterium]